MRKKQLRVAGIVAAAGLSKRMIDFKPLLPYAASTIIQTSIELLQHAGVEQIIVVVGYRGDEIKAQVSDMKNVEVIYNLNYLNGDMLESIQLGLRQVRNCDAAYVLPGDMPAIAPETFHGVRKCMELTDASVVFPTLKGRKKHPPLIACRCFESIQRFHGDGGLHIALQQFYKQTAYVAVADFGCSLDADTPTDYHQLLEYHSSMNGKCSIKINHLQR
jgi:molybdenum cofactor cytidylyltransferase